MSKKRIHDSTKRRKQDSHSVGSHVDRYASKVRADDSTRINSGEIIQSQREYHIIRRVMPNVLRSITATGYVPLVELITPLDAVELRRVEPLEQTRLRFVHGKIGGISLSSQITVDEYRLFDNLLVHRLAITQSDHATEIASDQEVARNLFGIEDNRASTLLIPVKEGTALEMTAELAEFEFETPQSLSKAQIISAENLTDLYLDRSFAQYASR